MFVDPDKIGKTFTKVLAILLLVLFIVIFLLNVI